MKVIENCRSKIRTKKLLKVRDKLQRRKYFKKIKVQIMQKIKYKPHSESKCFLLTLPKKNKKIMN